jgi:hypothetical protein
MSLRAALLVPLALAGCAAPHRSACEQARDDGYLRGQSDAVKQLYWAKQALEAPPAGRPAGRLEYYTWPEAAVTPDGRRLAPENVAVPVFIPAPLPAGGRP